MDQSPNAELNDIRNCSDACRRVAIELPDRDERTIWFNQWAEWTSKAANHQDSSAQDLRNAAGIYFSLKQYDTAAGLRERAAERELTWEDLKKTASTYNMAQ